MLFDRDVDVDEDEAEDKGDGEADEMLVEGSFELESSCLLLDLLKKLGTKLFMVCLIRPSLYFFVDWCCLGVVSMLLSYMGDLERLGS